MFYHDTIEDTDTSYEILIEKFGKQIADIVLECTDDKSLSKVDRKKSQIEHVKSDSMSIEAKYVKLADKLSNLSSLADDPPVAWSKFVIKGYVVWSYFVCRELFGLNEILDSQLEDVFNKFGINKTNTPEKQLTDVLDHYLNSL